MKLDRQTFDEQRSPRFGRSNPERMRLAFWEAMVQDGVGPYQLRKRFTTKVSFIQLINRSGAPIFGSFRAPREVLTECWKALVARVTRRKQRRLIDGGPIWCFERMGQTRTVLADGRTICIGGEHEDHYDPDFCIYNDVVVLGPDDEVEIYGYPKEIFPPTDFHTASLIGGHIIIIGSLGYPDDRRPGFTPVQRLDLSNYRIEQIATQGDPPGWIHDHEAEVDPSGQSITIRGGEIIEEKEGNQVTRLNLEEYRLHLADGRWERLTDRRAWRQFEIRRVTYGMLFDLPDLSNIRCGDPLPRFGLDEDVFKLTQIPYELYPIEERQQYELVVDEITIRALANPFGLRLIVEGALPRPVIDRTLAEIAENIEAIVGASCQINEL